MPYGIPHDTNNYLGFSSIKNEAETMAKIKRITVEFDDGTARELTRRQFISLVRDISYGTVKEALGIASKRRKRKK